jgi:hypothetical protein
VSDYPWQLDVRPLTTWPGILLGWNQRRQAPFRAPLRSTLATLTRELGALDARHPVLEVAIPADQFRLDGRPRAQAKAEHPGIVLSLPATNVGPLRYATDTFDTWQDNLRGISLGLEALRKVERYGITRRGEQYAGFKALPPGQGAIAMGGMTRDEAHQVVGQLAGLGNDEQITDDVIRKAKGAAHPDRNGGQRTLWDELERALQVLERDA